MCFEYRELVKTMYLNLKNSDLKKYVYRIIPYDRLVQLFEKQENTLVKPELWEDTFENFALKSQFRTESGNIVQYDVNERMYGQCWTLEKASDAMWRIYSPDKKSIRIRTTINNLLDSIALATVDQVHCEHCVGKVEYLREKELVNRAKSTFGNNGEVTFGNLFRSLLVKRKVFKHENEVRLIFYDWSKTAGSKKIFKYTIEPHKLITQMMIDPRISYEEFKKMKSDIRNKTGFKGGIKRSLLYRLPQSLTFDINEPKT